MCVHARYTYSIYLRELIESVPSSGVQKEQEEHLGWLVGTSPFFSRNVTFLFLSLSLSLSVCSLTAVAGKVQKAAIILIGRFRSSYCSTYVVHINLAA